MLQILSMIFHLAFYRQYLNSWMTDSMTCIIGIFSAWSIWVDYNSVHLFIRSFPFPSCQVSVRSIAPLSDSFPFFTSRLESLVLIFTIQRLAKRPDKSMWREWKWECECEWMDQCPYHSSKILCFVKSHSPKCEVQLEKLGQTRVVGLRDIPIPQEISLSDHYHYRFLDREELSC